MSEKINPDLFARIMGLEKPARMELLEFMGETPISEVEVERLIEEMSKTDSTEKRKPS